MPYPEKNATYKHTPKYIDRMKAEEGRAVGGVVPDTSSPPKMSEATDVASAALPTN